MRKRTCLKAAVITAIVMSMTPLAAAAERGGRKGGAKKGAVKESALVVEMKALDSAFREIVSAVAVADGHRVHKALETMHGKMEKTREELHAGQVKLRKNADKINDFERMDKEFHADLEKLAKAAEKGEGGTMTTLAKRLLDGCVTCHKRFRP